MMPTNAIDGSTATAIGMRFKRFQDAHNSILADYPVLQPLTSYDRFSESYELLRPYLSPEATIVDAGAWPGVLAGTLGRLGLDLVAVDKDPHRPLEWSQEVLVHESGLAGVKSTFTLDGYCRQEAIRCVGADIERDRLPLADESIDVVILTEVLEHLWHDPLHALIEINRVLKKDTGILFLSTPNLCSIRNRLNFLGGRIDRVIENPFVSFLKARRVGHMGHCRLYAPDELAAMLTLLGFDPRISFARYRQYRAVPSSPTNGTGAGSTQQNLHPSATRKGIRKVIRNPRNYLAAAQATTIAAIEGLVPSFRPQIYVVATKVNDAEFEKNHPSKLHELVMSNRIRGSK